MRMAADVPVAEMELCPACVHVAAQLMADPALPEPLHRYRIGLAAVHLVLHTPGYTEVPA